MNRQSPLWPARLHHIRIDSGDPGAMTDFYRRGFGFAEEPVGEGVTLLAGAERRLLIGKGKSGTLPYMGFALDDPAQLDAYRAFLQAKGFNLRPSPSPLFGEEAFALDDPDGHAVVFGLVTEPDENYDRQPGRLQHAVVATRQLGKMAGFYIDGLGFTVSDWVEEEDGAPSACFVRSDPEHHSFAAFAADGPRFDHHAYEVDCWDDIRDWADHFASLEVPIWWGPGRHGPGNNLFIMVEDPDGNKVELSAEIEHMHRHMPHRTWKHEERTLNLWGNAWMRS